MYILYANEYNAKTLIDTQNKFSICLTITYIEGKNTKLEIVQITQLATQRI